MTHIDIFYRGLVAAPVSLPLFLTELNQKLSHTLLILKFTKIEFI